MYPRLRVISSPYRLRGAMMLISMREGFRLEVSKRHTLMSRLFEEIEKTTLPVVESHDCSIVDLVFRREAVGRVLRLYLEKAGTGSLKDSGVTVDTCAAVSRDLAIALDASELIEGPYTLEVSSAGLDRPLKKLEDFERFRGSKVRIKTSAPIDKRRTFTGQIVSVEQGVVHLEMKGSSRMEIPHGKIKKANLVPEIKWN